jgi:5-methylcytosine-specific restriction endonuclease McrA
MKRQCVQCGDSFQAKREEHAFCSEKCRRAARGSDYRRNRDLALRRDDYECTDCGSELLLECHHRKPLYLGGNHDLSNLQTLCRSCHKQIHREWRRNGYTEDTKDTKDTEKTKITKEETAGTAGGTGHKGRNGREEYDHAA